jgi:flagellar basal-body rod modification protein FlgD
MATTTPVGSTTANSVIAQFTAAAEAKSEGAQDRFLKLLVTQMQNQDPLNPMENAEVTSQIAQINTVTGIDKLNTSVTSMSDRLANAQSIQASSMIGRHVLAAGNRVEFDGTSAPLTFDLPERAASVNVSIVDDKGATLYSQDLRATDSGRQVIAWDGTLKDATETAAAGVYTFRVEALDAKGTKINTTTYGYARVGSVTLENGGVTVNTKALGAIAVDSVDAII